MSLDQYKVRLQVPGSVTRNVRDLIKSLAYARLPLQPAVVWNGIDSRRIVCPVRRDAASPACPARNTTSPIGPPVHTTMPGDLPTHPTIPGQVTATSSSSPPPSITTTTLTSSSNSPPPGITLTVPSDFNSAGRYDYDASTFQHRDGLVYYTLTISLSGSTATTVTFTDP